MWPTCNLNAPVHSYSRRWGGNTFDNSKIFTRFTHCIHTYQNSDPGDKKVADLRNRREEGQESIETSFWNETPVAYIVTSIYFSVQLVFSSRCELFPIPSKIKTSKRTVSNETNKSYVANRAGAIYCYFRGLSQPYYLSRSLSVYVCLCVCVCVCVCVQTEAQVLCLLEISTLGSVLGKWQ